MWKTLSGFWAQMGQFAYILPPETAHIHRVATGLPFFRRPYGATTVYVEEAVEELLAGSGRGVIL
jgi:hypothetical protein